MYYVTTFDVKNKQSPFIRKRHNRYLFNAAAAAQYEEEEVDTCCLKRCFGAPFLGGLGSIETGCCVLLGGFL